MMADSPSNYLQWNTPNFITVVLMAMLGMFVVGMIASAVRTYRGTASTVVGAD